jgi:hypothetical protein
MVTTDTEVQFNYRNHFLDSSTIVGTVPHGSTVSSIVNQTGIPAELSDNIRVFIGDKLVERKNWGLVKPHPNANVVIGLAPMGGDLFKTLALIAVSVLAPQIAAGIAPGLFTAQGVAIGLGGQLLTAGIGLLGTLLVNALFPPPAAATQQTSAAESPTLSISSQSNSSYPYGPVRRVYGTHKIYPVVVGSQYTQTVGEIQYLYGLFDFGYGVLDVNNIEIGNTPIAQYDEAEYIVRNDTDFEIYTNDVSTESIGSLLESNGDTQTRNTATSSNGFEIDFTFASGLVGFNKDGGKRSRSVDFRVEYRAVGDDEWINATGGSFYTSGSNVVAGDSQNITLTPKEYVASLMDYGEGSSGYQLKYVGFDTRSSNTFSYSGEDPESGMYVKISGTNIKISSVDTVSKTVTLVSNGEHYPITNCQNQASGIPICPVPSDYNTVASTAAPDGSIRITAKRQNSVLASFGVRGLDAEEYEVRLTRLSASGGGDFQNSDDATWASLKSYKDSSPVNETKTHTYIELKIKASEELSGAIQSLSAICTSRLNVWDGSEWTVQPTSNPAWIFADIITGSAVNKPLSLDRLDTTSLKNWADYCDLEVNEGEGPRITTNFVVDYNTTAKELLNQVTAAGRATMIQANGKYGVAIDEEKTIPVQQFTPRNSWGFSSSRTYIDTPQAIKVKFVDPDNDWQVRERIVYNDGFDDNNTSQLDELDYFGCISADQAYRYGRYMMAQGILRQEKISLSVDMEMFTFTRGDLVRYTNDVMMVGGLPARIQSISGNDVTIDEIFAPEVGTYVYEHRTNGVVNSGSITSIVSPSVVEVDDATNMQEGDLIVLGLTGEISIDLLVQSINYNDDYTADLVLVEYAPAIFTADTEEIPAYDPNLSNGLLGAITEAEDLISAEYITFNNDGTANVFVNISWKDNSVITKSVIYLSVDGSEPISIATTDEYDYTYTVTEDDLGLEHVFYVDTYNALGNHSGSLAASSTSLTPEGDITPPDDVENMRLSVISETIQIEFDSLDDPSLAYYEIRYSPLTAGAIWNTSQVLIQRVSKNLTSASVSSRVGTYLIKAVDGSGNYSANAGMARTTIPALSALNVIDTVNDAPSWLGTKSNIEVVNNGLSLEFQGDGIYYMNGRYEYNSLIDLGEIYTSRLSNKIQVRGRSNDDLLANWGALSTVTAMQTWEDGDFSANVLVRTASEIESLDDWGPLDTVTSMVQSSNWSQWRSLTTGDYTGRYIQFAIELNSANGLVTPVVSDGLIEIDMPDRFDSGDNIISGTGITSITYSPAFRVKPSLQVTMDDSETGDYYKITDSTRSGFNIQFFDSTDTAISRQFDWAAKGYGAESTEVI